MENEQDIQKKYKSSCIKWYKRKHLAEMDGKEFEEAKPAKDWNERMEKTKVVVGDVSKVAGKNLMIGVGLAKVHGGAAASWTGAKASTLKEKI